MVNRTGKTSQPIWVKKGQTAKVGATPKAHNNLSKLGDAYAKLNANPNLKDKVGNGRILHNEDTHMPSTIASKVSDPKNLPKVGSGTALSSGKGPKIGFAKHNLPKGY